MDRQQALLSWIQAQLNDDSCYIKPASSDASFRSYWRVFSQGQTYIVMDAPPEQENCLPFIDISKKLDICGVQVPVVLAKDLQQGFLLITDLGTVQYLDVLNQGNHQTLYKDACKALHLIQQKASQDSLPKYNKALLQQELDLFEQWFINKHLNVSLNSEQSKLLKKTFELLIDNAVQQPQTFVHRDYHSRNLMKTKDNNPGILDFQDAVIGAVTYDLVSLLKDCYIRWDESIINQLSDDFRLQYNKLNNSNIESAVWQRWLDLTGLQRHLKVLGIFCRLNYRDHKPNYLKDLNLTMCYIKSTCTKYQELRPLLDLINDISPSMDNLCE
ncbi:MAG: phosphotransferase [Proteobacteria bacterium]|nr:phosphotransferase [Pseudomonadota bacterium]